MLLRILPANLETDPVLLLKGEQGHCGGAASENVMIIRSFIYLTRFRSDYTAFVQGNGLNGGPSGSNPQGQGGLA